MESKVILRTSISLIIISFSMKILALIREIVLAYFYGTSYIADVYVVVQSIPSIIFVFFGSAISSSFIPLYTNLKKDDENKSRQFVNNIISIFVLISAILCFFGIIFSKQLVHLFAGGLKGEAFFLCNNFAKIIMPTSVAIIVVNILNSYLQANGKFNQNSLVNVPYNIIQILFIIFAFYLSNVYILSVGILLSSFGQLVYLLIKAKKIGFKFKLRLHFKDENFIKMIVLVGPIFISTCAAEINSIIDKMLASGLNEGTLSAMNYSLEIINIVIQVIIMSITTIVFPTLSKKSENKKDMINFSESILSFIFIIISPLFIFIFLFSKEIVSLLFGYGAFDDNSIKYTSLLLKILSVNIIFVSIRDGLNKVFFADKNTKIPSLCAVISVFINIILNFAFVKKYQAEGLCYATIIANAVGTLVLLFIYLFKYKELNIKSFLGDILKIIIISFLSFFVGVFLFDIINIEISILKMFVVFGAIILLYFILLILIREKEISNLIKTIRGK